MDLSTQIEARGATYRFAGSYAPPYRAVVDVWGSWRDGAMRVTWDAPTATICIISAAKGMTAPMIDKEKSLVRHFLHHTAAVPAERG